MILKIGVAISLLLICLQGRSQSNQIKELLPKGNPIITNIYTADPAAMV